MQGTMSEARKAVVRAAYNKLDVNKDGKVTLKDLAQVVDVSTHPDVLARLRSEEDIYRDFIAQWDTQKVQGFCHKSAWQYP